MPSSSAKLDQALADLIEAFTELEIELDGKFGEDEDTYTSAIIETVEAAIEKNITHLGFSDHVPLPDNNWNIRMPYSELPDYNSDLENAKNKTS